MDGNKRQRGVYVSARQKKKLLEFITKHPELITCKVTQDFSYRDSQKLWMAIANECNSIPGARKTWRQWRKVVIFSIICTILYIVEGIPSIKNFNTFLAAFFIIYIF